MKKLAFVIVFCLLVGSAAAHADELEGFGDIESHGAQSVIERFESLDVVNGYEGLFRPDDAISRAELCAVLNRIGRFDHFLPEIDNPFTDVARDAWYYADVLALYRTGVFGDSDMAYPENAVSRAELAVFICKALSIELTNGFAEPALTDADDFPNGTLRYVETLRQDGYIGVYPDGEFHPNESATRADVLLVLDRIITEIILEQTTYGGVEEVKRIDGNLFVSSSVVLENILVNGSVYILGGANGSAVEFVNSTVTGTVFVTPPVCAVNIEGDERSRINVNVLNPSRDTLVYNHSSATVLITLASPLNGFYGRFECVELWASDGYVNVTDVEIGRLLLNGMGCPTVATNERTVIEYMSVDDSVIVEGDGVIGSVTMTWVREGQTLTFEKAPETISLAPKAVAIVEGVMYTNDTDAFLVINP